MLKIEKKQKIDIKLALYQKNATESILGLILD